ncbi:SH3 domain-containing protein [Cystobacter fuscus]
MKTVLLALLLSAAGEDAGVLQKVYVQGSSVNLRKEPATDAEVLVKAPIGTECAVTDTASAEWMKVRCGDYEGYVAASLVGAEKPSVETLRAEAKNPMLKPERREESALRAALLAPEDVELSKLLGELFFERNFRLLAGFKGSGATKRTFSNTCGRGRVDNCLRDATLAFLRDARIRVETRKDLFVVAVKDPENVTVYRGNYKLDPETTMVTAEVLERSSFPSTPVMDKALFSGIEEVPGRKSDLPPGRFVLDDASHTLLSGIPSAWSLLKQDSEGRLWTPINDCLKKPYLLEFVPDIHGRWMMLREKEQKEERRSGLPPCRSGRMNSSCRLRRPTETPWPTWCSSCLRGVKISAT